MHVRFVLVAIAVLWISRAAVAQPVAGQPPDGFQVVFMAVPVSAPGTTGLRSFGVAVDPDASMNITNTGSSGGNICANVYVFSPDEQLVSCCACPITPNGLNSLSARTDLVSNTLTPGVPASIVVKLLATSGGTSCNAAAVTPANLASGMRAWATTIHIVPPAGLVLTENTAQPASLSTAELPRITALCGFIQANGSGFGICRSCRLGALAGSKM